MKNPANTSVIPKIRLSNTFNNTRPYSFSLNKLKFSNVKVENVVNDPKMPTKKNNLIFGLIITISDMPHNNPIINEPVRLTINVPRGKELLK